MVEAIKRLDIDLKPNIQDLQADILDLLKGISKLMGKAQRDLNDENSQKKYIESQKQIDREIHKVDNLELRMAIVAPMKAGKSTIINAIVGQDLLPSRNAAMTTIPTAISFNNDIDKPELSLAENTLKVFENTWLSLQQKINHLSKSELEDLISQYPHLQDLAKKIQSDRFYIPAKVTGKENIGLVLTQLNDLVRLCWTLDPSLDLLNKLENVPEIRTPFWRSNNTEQTKQLGNLVIIDTPGANEAGDNLRLTAVVEQELKNCSIVLIVLDFTQLNNQAAEAVKRQVQPIVNVIGKNNLYVLVNKVDQRLSGDMTPEQVKKFIYSDLNLSETEDSARIFEISARQAFSATQFLLELQQYPEIELPNMSSIEALAKQVLGNRWERKLQKKTTADLEEEAEFLWSELGKIDFKVNNLSREVTDYKTETKRPWYFLWIWEVKQEIEITRTESYYTVSLQDIVKQINTAIEANVNKINYQVDRYLDLDFKNSVDDYFSELDAYLSNYCNSLKQAKADGQLDIKKKEQIVKVFSYLIPETEQKLNKVFEYQNKVQLTMANTLKNKFVN